jgi:hypothetical protein
MSHIYQIFSKEEIPVTEVAKFNSNKLFLTLALMNQTRLFFARTNSNDLSKKLSSNLIYFSINHSKTV